MSASQAVLSGMQLTLHANRRIPHGASRLVLAMSAWSVKTRHAPSRHYRDVRVYGHTTTAMHYMGTPPLPLKFKVVFLHWICRFAYQPRQNAEDNHYDQRVHTVYRMHQYYLRGTIIIRTCDQHKKLYGPLFLRTIFGPDYYVPRY